MSAPVRVCASPWKCLHVGRCKRVRLSVFAHRARLRSPRLHKCLHVCACRFTSASAVHVVSGVCIAEYKCVCMVCSCVCVCKGVAWYGAARRRERECGRGCGRGRCVCTTLCGLLSHQGNSNSTYKSCDASIGPRSDSVLKRTDKERLCSFPTIWTVRSSVQGFKIT